MTCAFVAGHLSVPDLGFNMPQVEKNL